jgi:hypothetical protein
MPRTLVTQQVAGTSAVSKGGSLLGGGRSSISAMADQSQYHFERLAFTIAESTTLLHGIRLK